MVSKATSIPGATGASTEQPTPPLQVPMTDGEGNVHITLSDGSKYALRPPTGEDIEHIEGLVTAKASQVRLMCATISVLSLEPVELKEVLKWRFAKIKEVSEGLKSFPDFADGL